MFPFPPTPCSREPRPAHADGGVRSRGSSAHPDRCCSRRRQIRGLRAHSAGGGPEPPCTLQGSARGGREVGQGDGGEGRQERPRGRRSRGQEARKKGLAIQHPSRGVWESAQTRREVRSFDPNRLRAHSPRAAGRPSAETAPLASHRVPLGAPTAARDGPQGTPDGRARGQQAVMRLGPPPACPPPRAELGRLPRVPVGSRGCCPTGWRGRRAGRPGCHPAEAYRAEQRRNPPGCAAGAGGRPWCEGPAAPGHSGVPVAKKVDGRESGGEDGSERISREDLGTPR